MEENAVKQICSELGITQKELADTIGVAEQTVRGWSSNKETPQWAIKFFALIKEHKEDKKILDNLQNTLTLISERNKKI